MNQIQMHRDMFSHAALYIVPDPLMGGKWFFRFKALHVLGMSFGTPTLHMQNEESVNLWTWRGPDTKQTAQSQMSFSFVSSGPSSLGF